MSTAPAPPPRVSIVLPTAGAEAHLADLIAQCPETGFLPKSDLSAGAIRRILERRPP